MTKVLVTGSFDDLRSRHVRFLEEASKIGPLTVLLWSDPTTTALIGAPPKFPLKERRYLIDALRFVERTVVFEGVTRHRLCEQLLQEQPDITAVMEGDDPAGLQALCTENRKPVQVIPLQQVQGFPMPVHSYIPNQPDCKKVVVTGCYDWLHSGHVRFFEEVSELGDLYVVVGHDANVRHLKGEGHPLFPEDEQV
jgi:cytidyltransferase-like protein